MAERWKLHLASEHHVAPQPSTAAEPADAGTPQTAATGPTALPQLWQAEAGRLRATLDAVARQVQLAYGEQLLWRSEALSEVVWQDLDQIAQWLSRQQLRDDDGKIMPGGGSNGVVSGYLGGRRENMVTVLYAAGRDEWPFVFNMDVYADDHDSGARPLTDHDRDWLADLLADAAAAADAAQGRVRTTTLQRLLRAARNPNDVGLATLAPNGVQGQLPHDVTGHPRSSDRYPAATVLIGDLGRIEADPAALVPDLLAVDDAIKATVAR